MDGLLMVIKVTDPDFINLFLLVTQHSRSTFQDSPFTTRNCSELLLPASLLAAAVQVLDDSKKAGSGWKTLVPINQP